MHRLVAVEEKKRSERLEFEHAPNNSALDSAGGAVAVALAITER